MRKGVGTFSVVVVAMLVGCGSSGGGGTGGSGGSAGISGGKGGAGGAGNTSGGGPFTTSVPASTPLTGLSSAQQTQLCKDFTTYADATLVPALCKLDGLLAAAFTGGTTDAQVQAACAAGYSACLTADGGSTVMCNANGVPSTCTATVGDLTSCLNMQSAAFAQVPSCSTLTVASLAGAFGDGGSATEPAICMQFDSGGSCAGAVSMPSASAGTP
jgi:hypothetical protein